MKEIQLELEQLTAIINEVNAEIIKIEKKIALMIKKQTKQPTKILTIKSLSKVV